MMNRKRRMFCWLAVGVFLLIQGGCGSSGSQDSGEITYSVSVAFTDKETGAPTTVVSENNPVLVTVTVYANSVPLTNEYIVVVTDKGTFADSPDGTGLTDMYGQVTYTLEVTADDAGAGIITVELEDGSILDPAYKFTIGPPVAVELGSFTDGIFYPGVLNCSIGKDQLAAGSTAQITATLAYLEDGVYILYDDQVDIAFSTECRTAVVEETVTTQNGSASTTYRADGCSGGRDIVTATVTIAGEELTAEVEISLEIPATGSISFVSADPTVIALKGIADENRPSTSIVKFLVKDVLGNAVQGVRVNFTLEGTTGGVTIAPASAETDSDGIVQAVVAAGRVPTTIIVRATVDGLDISNVSSELVANTGLPDQNSFSLSADIINPEGWNYDGVEVVFTIRAADDYNNPVPDGTSISFVTEGGTIAGSCETNDGACSVTWFSNNPRPDGSEGFSSGEDRAGRVTVLATTLGQESFTDLDGNGLYDDTDILLTDIPEAFLDANENGEWDTDEWHLDPDSDGLYTEANGIYNGYLCNDSTACTDNLRHVSDSMVLIMSTSFADIDIDHSAITFNTEQDTDMVTFTIADMNGNSMPNGTKVEVTLSSNAETDSETTYTINNSTEPFVFSIVVASSSSFEPSEVGVLQVKVTTPKNNITTKSIYIYSPATSGDTVPKASFKATDFSDAAHPYRYSFEDTSTIDAEGDVWIEDWSWDFDYDGVTFEEDSDDQNPVHTFGSAGKYKVALKVRNNLGETSAIYTQVIEVKELGAE